MIAALDKLAADGYTVTRTRTHRETAAALRRRQLKEQAAQDKEKFQAGLVSELQLLEDERQFLKTNIREIESRLQIFQFALNLSKSLGLSLAEI